MMRQFFILILVLLLTLTWRAVESQVRPSATLSFGATFMNSGQGLGGETGNGLALGDLDGDGDTDAFVANDFGLDGSNQVWFNQGDGFFTGGPTLGNADGHAVALGDLENDGDLDAVVVSDAPSLIEWSPSGFGSVQVWLNQGGAQGGNEGDFAAGAAFGVFSSYGVAVGDVDNDGDLDTLVVGNSNQVWLNNGNATFIAGPALPFLFSQSAVLADMDADGWLDAVIADSQDGSSNRVYWNDGNWTPGPGSFTAGDPLPMGSLVPGVAVANLDEDSQPDIFLAGYGQDQIYWNEGSRSFTATVPLPVSDSSWAVALADVDGDTLLDAVVANTSADPNRLWHNEGGRVFTVTQEFGDELGLYWSRGVGLADLTGDGSPDLFEVTTAEDRVWFNTAVPPPPIPNEEGWQIQTVDERGRNGANASLALDANGYPHIAYASWAAAGYDSGETIWEFTLRYTRWDGVRWHTENVRSALEGIDDLSLALDGNGYPHIVYVWAYLAPPRYVYWDGAQWHDAPLSDIGDNIEYIKLALDTNGNRHISYKQNGRIKYAFWDGSSWLAEEIDTTDGPASLALDAAGNPHMSYVLSTYLKYAHKVGGTWQIEFADAESFTLSYETSLALDDEGRPHIAYFEDSLFSEYLVKYAHGDGNSWQIEIVNSLPSSHEFETLALDLDSSSNPHLFYVSVSLFGDPGTYYQYAHWDGASWQIETLDYSSYSVYDYPSPAIVLDGADHVHASYYEPRYSDLRYLTWAPNWQLRPLPETGTIQHPAIDVEATIPHIGYYDLTGGQVKLASWDEPWNLHPLVFVGNPVTDLSVDAGFVNEHASYYDADDQRLMYGYWDGSEWNMEVVDEAGDVGRYNDLMLLGNTDGSPLIVYWDDTSLRVKLARRDPTIFLWQIHPNNAGPALNADSGPLSTAVLPGGDIGVAYYDGLNDDLRLAVWDRETTTWTDELVDGAGADVGHLNSLQTDGTEGVPVVAYLGQGVLRYAYKVGSLWQVQDVPGTVGEEITGLSLELGLNSRQHARIAYTTGSGTLNVANLRDNQWEIEVVEDGVASLSEVTTARDNRLHLAYTLDGSPRYAFRTATLVTNVLAPLPPSDFYGYPGYYNPLDACQALLDLIIGDTSPNHGRLLTEAMGQPPVTPFTHDAPMGDLALFGAMNTLFVTTAGGQYYIDLYREHGSEMGQLGLNDPQLLWDAYGTLQNFLPGLEALVTGQGEEMIVTQEMVDDALDIWQRLAAAGSPELTAVINDELAQYNNLQDFVGLTFDEWAMAIGVNPPPENIYLPVIRND